MSDLRDELIFEAGSTMADVSLLPDWMSPVAISRDLLPVAEVAVDALMPRIEAELAKARDEALEQAARALVVEAGLESVEWTAGDAATFIRSLKAGGGS